MKSYYKTSIFLLVLAFLIGIPSFFGIFGAWGGLGMLLAISLGFIGFVFLLLGIQN